MPLIKIVKSSVILRFLTKRYGALQEDLLISEQGTITFLAEVCFSLSKLSSALADSVPIS
jgi:hypothetical protein